MSCKPMFHSNSYERLKEMDDHRKTEKNAQDINAARNVLSHDRRST
jgi:hypothetical protein